MDVSFAMRLNVMAMAGEEVPAFRIHAKPTWSTTVYVTESKGEKFYMIYDSRRSAFVTVLTQVMIDERDGSNFSYSPKHNAPVAAC